MKTVSKREAMRLSNRSTYLTRFDKGKYKWHGSCQDYIGVDVTDIEGVLAVFPERRQDSHGPYAQLRCVTL